MIGVLLQALACNLQRSLKIMIQEKSKCIAQDIVLSSKIRVNKISISLHSVTETVIRIIDLCQCLISLQIIRSNLLQLLQLGNSLRRAGRLISSRILQICLVTIGIEINGLFIQLASLTNVFLVQSNITFQQRDTRVLLISLLGLFKKFIHLLILLCFPIHLRQSQNQVDILLVLALHQILGHIPRLFRVSFNQFFHLIHTSLPLGSRRLRGNHTCEQ